MSYNDEIRNINRQFAGKDQDVEFYFAESDELNNNNCGITATSTDEEIAKRAKELIDIAREGGVELTGDVEDYLRGCRYNAQCAPTEDYF